jgi:hypothetical protein
MQRLSAPERTREELRALMNGDLGTAAGRGDLVRLALRLIAEEALEGEVSEALGRERYERGEGEKPGYRNGYRTGKVKTAEAQSNTPRRRFATRPSRSSRACARRWRDARGNSSGWRWRSTRAVCRRAISRMRSPTRRAEGFCRERR